MRISVVIATVRPGTLGETVASIRAQDHTDWEMVIVTQEADDHFRSVVDGFLADDARIRHIDLPRKGLSLARNAGVRAATSDIIAFIDDDAAADPTWLGVIAEAFEADPDLGFVGGAVLAPEGAEKGNCPTNEPIELRYVGQRGIPAPDGWDWIGCNFAMRRSVFDTVGPFDEELGAGTPWPSGEDTDLKLRAEAMRVPMLATPRSIVVHTHGVRSGFKARWRHQRNYSLGNGSMAAKLTLSGDPRGRAWMRETLSECLWGPFASRRPAELVPEARRLWHFVRAYRTVRSQYIVNREHHLLVPVSGRPVAATPQGVVPAMKARAEHAVRGGTPALVAPRPLTTEPSVTVVIPCYNYGRYLPDCVASALDNPGVDVDVVIVDDCSTDDSAAVAEALAAADPRVRLVRHAVNAGHIATYNDGLAEIRGDYVVVLSADDLLTPGALTRATSLMEHHREVGMVYGHILCFDEDGRPEARTDVDQWALWTGADWLARRWHTAKNCIWSPEVVMRSDVQRKIGGYRADLPHTGDLEMWMRAAAVADVGYIVGADQAWYRFHGKNMHQTMFQGAESAGVLVDLRHARFTFEVLAAEEAAGADLPAARRGLAMRAVKVLARNDIEPELGTALLAFAREVEPAVLRTAWGRTAQARLTDGALRPQKHPWLFARLSVLAVRDRLQRLSWEAVGG